MKRVLAVAVAVLMIAGALVVRGMIRGDDNGGSGGGGGGKGGGDLTLGCVTELMDVCGKVDGVKTVEVNPGEVARNASKIDAWVTFDPWPEAEQFGGATLFEKDRFSIGEDRIGLLYSKPYGDGLRSSCDESLIACAAKAPGNQGHLGVGNPKTALGAVLFSATLTDLIGNADFDGEATDGIPGNLRVALDPDNRGSSETQVADQARLARGSPGLVVCREHDANTYVGRPRGREIDFVFVPTKPATRVRIVLAPIEGHDAKKLKKVAESASGSDAFTKAGWRSPTKDPTGLPEGDVMLALVDGLKN